MGVAELVVDYELLEWRLIDEIPQALHIVSGPGCRAEIYSLQIVESSRWIGSSHNVLGLVSTQFVAIEFKDRHWASCVQNVNG